MLSICEYYRYSGDASLVRECLPEATAKVERAAQKINKDGAPYTILFISEDREIQGVSYTAEAPIFAFGPSHQEASAVQGGETIKAIVSRRDNNGDVTYTLRKIVK